MADLDVQPKKKGSLLPWILLGLGILALLFFLLRGCGNNKETGTATSDSASTTSTNMNTGGLVASTKPAWDSVNFNAPAASYEEITDTNINVRGGDAYAIYSLGENVLFDSDKSTLKSGAEQNLKQIAASLNKRFNGGEVRIYGHTDAQGTKGYNKQLAEQRAEAVRNWLVKNGNIGDDKISLHPVGESQPVASNATSEGRQQNRRVEIVARQK